MMKLSNKLQNSSYNLKSNKGKRDSIQESYDVFGKELRLLVETRQLPELICMLGYIIKHYGVLSQGLFRISGNKTRMDELRAIYSQSKRLEVGIDDIHNITGLFKSFLREVPGGVIPCPQSLDLIKSFLSDIQSIQATRIYKRNENLDLLTDELFKLPVPNYNLLKFTCSLLYKVSQYSASNLMTPDNLGTVFGPTFFASVEDVSLLPLANSASTILIQNYNSLFKVSAPVHTNLNQTTTETSHSINDFNADYANGYVTKTFADHILTIQFGDSCLLFSSNGETDNSLFSYSIQDDEPMPFPELQDSFIANNSFASHSQFSTSLDLALRMCLTNHLFNQFHDNNDLVTDAEQRICAPRLICDTMLNPHDYDSIKQPSSNLQMKNIGKKKTIDESSTLSLPRREISSNILQSYLTNHNTDQKAFETIVKQEPSQTASENVQNSDVNFEKQTHPVPQLDLSILYDTSASEKIRLAQESKTVDVSKNKHQTSFENSREQNSEPKNPDNDSSLNHIKRSITNLKRQLRQFEDEFYSNHGVRPDKSVRANNEWYSRSIAELKLLRQEKEQLMNGNDKTDDYESAESVKNVRKKSIGASGDINELRSGYGISSDTRAVMLRPISALSEVAVRITPSNESARSSTLNSMTTVTNQAPDLSQCELNSLKIALEKISNHLIAERMRDNRPNDLDLMSQQQIETEKVSMQKALLNFESTYGRKKTPNAVYLMRPLYDRYRQVKKRLGMLNETQGLEWKIAQRTLNSQSKPDMYQPAWTSDRPLSSGMQSLNRANPPQISNRPIYLPTTSQFDIGEEYMSQAPRRSDPSNDNSQINNTQSQRRNVRTIQYRRTSAGQSSANDTNNNRASTLKEELHQLHVEKKDLQRILKDFENTFERDTKRKVEKLDRLPMEREYSRYKFIKNRIKELEESLEITPLS